MKKAILLLSLSLLTLHATSQTYLDSTLNSATKRILFANPNQFSIGSYGEAHYNQAFHSDEFSNGEVDLHRVILFMGYKFNKNFQFFSEIEFEHVHELSVEQAYINYSYNSLINVKAGVILIPMGYVNEFHEPTLFNGVERSSVDKYIIPSTWHEMGVGFHGLFKRANLKYQLYMVNGLTGYNGAAKISGSGIRSGRQGGGESVFRTPAFTGKLSFFGLNGLRLGVSGYYGNTESSMYDGLNRTDNHLVKTADSTRLGVAMGAVNMQYTLKNLQFTAVGNYTSLSNVTAYNEYTGSNAGSKIFGYYGELAYTQRLKKDQDYPRVIPFVRYQNYDTQAEVEGISRTKSYHREEFTAGAGLQITPGTVIKTDYQWIWNEANRKPYNMLNIGFGYWF